MTQIPLAIFAYNRPRHLRRALDALAGCERFGDCRLHIYCDGPKPTGPTAPVAETRRVVREWAAQVDRPAQVTERAENLGLARSIVAGVSELCADYGRVIVVEDDLIVGPGFLDYMLRALQRYEDAPRICQVAGYMYPVRHSPKPDAFLLPFINTWGWATWERAWRLFDWNPAGAVDRLADLETRRRFELDDNSTRFTTMLRERLSGQNDSWGILWRYAVFNAGGLVLYPRRSFVWVGGFDGSGVHSGYASKLPRASLRAVQRATLGSDFAWPDQVVVDEAALQLVKQFLREGRRLRNRSLAARLRSGLRRRLAALGSASRQ